MRITLDAREIEVPSGQYGEEDDLLCKGCGHETIVWDNHRLLDCLQVMRKQIAELQKKAGIPCQYCSGQDHLQDSCGCPCHTEEG